MKRYPIELVKKYIYKILCYYRLEESVIESIMNCMITADACGVHSHGLTVLEAHLERLDRGGYCVDVKPEIIKQTDAFAVVDAKNTFGFVSGTYCMRLAMHKAKKSGIYIVFSKNCNTYGPAFYYTKLATNQNLIGITFCNSPAAMPAWGGKDKLLGTNPLAVGIPGNVEGPIMFDMSTSVVAKSKINEARKSGMEIPEGWALDENGNSTTDPIEAIKGLVLPMAGPKGYGLAMTIDIMAGLLSGASCLNRVNRFYSEDNSPMDVGQVFITIDPSIVSSEDFYVEVDDYIKVIKNSRSIDGEEVRFPGERKIKEYEESLQKGIKLTNTTVDSINRILEKCEFKERL